MPLANGQTAEVVTRRKKQSRHFANALPDTKQNGTRSASVKFLRNVLESKKLWQSQICALQRTPCANTD